MKPKNLILIIAFMLTTACVQDHEIITSKIHYAQPQQEFAKPFETFINSCHNTRDNSFTFPESYGGAYLSSSGDFIVNTTDISDENQQYLSELINIDGIIFNTCSYSYNQLLSVKQEIDNYLINNSGTIKLNNIKSAYIDICENNVIVTLKNCSPSHISEFKANICNSDTIKFIQSELQTKDNLSDNTSKICKVSTRAAIGNQTLNLSTGMCLCDDVTNPDSLTFSSIAYRARLYNGTNGFVTSANIATSYNCNAYYYFNGVKHLAGSCVVRQSSNNINAAFYQFTGSSLSNILPYNGYTCTYSTTTPPQPAAFTPNTTVAFYGTKTLELNNGEPSKSVIVGNNCTIVGYGNITYTGLAMSRYSTQESADCGGLVAGLESSRVLRVYGIHLIRDGINSYFIPAYNINQAFGLTIY